MKKVFPYLTYVGATPFVFCAMCFYLGIHDIPLLGSVKRILAAYGLVISSFLAGAHWGQHLHIDKSQWIRFLPIFSNVIAVLLWLGFLVLSFKMQMAMFVAAFVVLLIIDHRLFRQHCVFHNGHYVKDLSILGRELERTFILDNSPMSYLFQPDNAVAVTSFIDSMEDRELPNMLPFLEKLVNVPPNHLSTT